MFNSFSNLKYYQYQMTCWANSAFASYEKNVNKCSLSSVKWVNQSNNVQKLRRKPKIPYLQSHSFHNVQWVISYVMFANTFTVTVIVRHNVQKLGEQNLRILFEVPLQASIKPTMHPNDRPQLLYPFLSTSELPPKVFRTFETNSQLFQIKLKSYPL